MSEERFKIGVFAFSQATETYLCDIVRYAGYDAAPDDNAASVRIYADKSIEKSSGLDATTKISIKIKKNSLKKDDSESDTALDLPFKAEKLIKTIQKAVFSLEIGQNEIYFGKATLNIKEKSWMKNDKNSVRLTEKEVYILQCLHAHKGSVVSRQTLLREIWSYAEDLDTHTLETHIYRLRQKIEDDPSNPSVILTMPDGYKVA